MSQGEESLFETIRRQSQDNLAEIERRFRENDPLEIRTIPNANLSLRVLGYVCGGYPVIHCDDSRAFDEWAHKQYKCHWCCDNRRVYLHGEQKLPPSERGQGSPCPRCVKKFTSNNYCAEADQLPTDKVFDLPQIMRGLITAYEKTVIPPQVTFAKYEAILEVLGGTISLDGWGLDFYWQEFANAPGSDDGRIWLVNDRN